MKKAQQRCQPNALEKCGHTLAFHPQVIAYTGAIPHGVLGSGRPSDLTPSGAFPKTWRKIDGQLVLFKAGSTVAAPNYGREPYSEFLAWQVAKAAELNAVKYNLAEWQGKICSTCNLFNTPDVAFVPFELCLPIDIMQLCDFELALAYFENVGAEASEQFKSMAVFDSIIANTDRHQGNFGILRNNHTGQVLCMAPIFDNNVSLFSRDDDEVLETQLLLARTQESPGILDATLGLQGSAMLGAVQRIQVARLVDFEFEQGGFIEEYRDTHPEGKTLTKARLDALGAFVRQRARNLLS